MCYLQKDLVVSELCWANMLQFLGHSVIFQQIFSRNVLVGILKPSWNKPQCSAQYQQRGEEISEIFHFEDEVSKNAHHFCTNLTPIFARKVVLLLKSVTATETPSRKNIADQTLDPWISFI